MGKIQVRTCIRRRCYRKILHLPRRVISDGRSQELYEVSLPVQVAIGLGVVNVGE